MATREGKDRFTGCLVGQCLGDALGFPVEGYVADVCRQYVDGILRTGRAGAVGRPPFAFGQYTDDSQLARELLVSYRNCRRFDPSDYAARIAGLFRSEKIVGGGRTTGEAARRLSEGTGWEESGAPQEAAGNGSAMRAGPIGLLFFDDPEGLVNAAVDQGRITHRDSRCGAGSVAVAGAVALALRGETKSRDFLDRLADWTETVDATVAAALRRLEAWMELPPGEAVVLVGRAGLDGPPGKEWKGITPYVVGSVLWSIYSFLKSPDDYWETICTAIAAGGDTDTTAAMAGAISGARLGISSLPAELTARLNDGGEWGLDMLRTLAEECFDLKDSGSPVSGHP
jgi:ADP-ribosylglycohydrolase